MNCWTALILACGIALGHAQVTVELSFDESHYLQDESLPLLVKITNDSGQGLNLGGTDDWLSFQIISEGNRIAKQTRPVPVKQPFLMPSGQHGKRIYDLVPYFELPAGRYRIRATVRIPQWNKDLTSEPAVIEIVRGARIWEKVIGIPQASGPPEARRYTLQQANSLKRPHLYARIASGNDTKVFHVVKLGPLVSFSRPEAQTDADSNLHVLFQTGARSFNYSILDPHGELIGRQRHDYTRTRPVLKVDAQGQVAVRGGVRRVSLNDIPKPALKPPPQIDNAPPPTPTPTPTPAPTPVP